MSLARGRPQEKLVTKTILGIESAIVVDRAYEDGELIEETFDWYAQDDEGNVWYMGEASAEFDDGEMVGTAGSFEAGKDVAGLGATASAGILIKANPVVGDSYQQEFYEGEAEDMAEVVDLAASVTLSDGTTYAALQTHEWNPLEEDSDEYKYYAEGIGLVLETKFDSSERVDLIETSDDTMPVIEASNFENSTLIDNTYFPRVPGTITTYEIEIDGEIERFTEEVLTETREVMGISVVVVRVREYEDDLLTEDTHDWFAQDNDGTVWYMGEEVDVYNYDDDDNLIDITHEGAWEAGVAGAQPGIVVPAEPRVGDSYRLEYLAGEAEDTAVIDAVNVPITLGDGTSYTCLKVKEWNPLEEDSVEFKYYAPGVGLVREEDEEGEEQVDLQP